MRDAAVAYSAKLQQTVDAACKAATPKPDEPPVINAFQIKGPMVPYLLHFAQDGSRVVPAPSPGNAMNRAGIGPDEATP